MSSYERVTRARAVPEEARSGADAVLEAGQPEQACGISHLRANSRESHTRPPRNARKIQKLRDLRERMGASKMLRSGPEVAASGPPRKGLRKFFIRKALRGLRPQREWSLPTLRRLRRHSLSGYSFGSPQREWSLPTLRLRRLDSGRHLVARELPQREWSLPTLRPTVPPTSMNEFEKLPPQREWSLPTLRHRRRVDGRGRRVAAA